MEKRLFSLRNIIMFLFLPFRKSPYFMLFVVFLYEIFLIAYSVYVGIYPEFLGLNQDVETTKTFWELITFRGELATSHAHILLVMQIFWVVPFLTRTSNYLVDYHSGWNLFLYVVLAFFTIFVILGVPNWQMITEYVYLQMFWLIITIFVQFKYSLLKTEEYDTYGDTAFDPFDI